MSSTPNPAPAAPVVPETTVKVTSPSLNLNERIATIISESAPARVLDQTLKVFVDKEVDKRATALIGGINLANETRGALSKAKQPDVRPTTFDAAGAPMGSPGFTKPALTKIKQLTEKLAKIDKAIEAATRDANPDFSLLYNLKGEIEKADKEAATEPSVE